MTSTSDDARRAEGDAARLAYTVTMLQDAAGSGHPVMFPGTRESRPTAPAAEEPHGPPGGCAHVSTAPLPDHTGRAGHVMIWLVDRLIGLMRVAPAR